MEANIRLHLFIPQILRLITLIFVYFCHGGYVLSAVSEHQGLCSEITYKSIEGFRRIGVGVLRRPSIVFMPFSPIVTFLLNLFARGTAYRFYPYFCIVID